MRAKLWWVCGVTASLIAAVFVAVFASRGRYQRRAVFPDSPPAIRLPIRAPLVRPDLSVVATLQSGRRTAPIWMTIDSGATGVTLPAPTFHALGLDALRGVTVRQEDPTGRIMVREAGLVPQLKLGALVVEEVVTAIGGPPVVGQSILAHRPWEIDWDLGVVTLGATPWPDATRVPIRRVGDAEVVTMNIDGAPVDMVIDTGAFASLIPESVGSAAGISSRRVAPTVMRSLGGEMIVRRVFVGEAQLGAVNVGHLEVAAIVTGGKRASLGLLGLDVLSRYQLQIVPGSHLAVRPRGDVHQTAAARIGRWSFMPRSCPHVGCVHAELYGAELTVTLEAALTEPVEVLLGCPGAARHVRVRLPNHASGIVGRTTVSSAGEIGCPSLHALDVSPILPSQEDPLPAGGELLAMVWP